MNNKQKYSALINILVLLFSSFTFTIICGQSSSLGFTKIHEYDVVKCDDVNFRIKSVQSSYDTKYFLILSNKDKNSFISIDETTLSTILQDIPRLLKVFTSDTTTYPIPNSQSYILKTDYELELGYLNYIKDNFVFWFIRNGRSVEYNFLSYDDLSFPLYTASKMIENIKTQNSLDDNYQLINDWLANRIPDWIKEIKDPNERLEMMKVMGYE